MSDVRCSAPAECNLQPLPAAARDFLFGSYFVQSIMMAASMGCSVQCAATMLRPSYNETSTSIPFEPDNNFLFAVCSVVDRRFRAHCGHTVPMLGRRGPAKKSKTPPALYVLHLACFIRLLYVAYETINVSSHGVYILKSFRSECYTLIFISIPVSIASVILRVSNALNGNYEFKDLRSNTIL